VIGLTLLRNASLLLEVGGQRLLVDPMLAPVGALPAVDPETDSRRNPLVPLSIDPTALVHGLDAALVTHLHRDHFDADAAERLPLDTLLVTQPESAPVLRWMGFSNVRDTQSLTLGSVQITRTPARHTLDPELTDALGPTCGFALTAPGEPRLLVAGDCVWCDELATAVHDQRPDVIVVNAGAARIGSSMPISMTADDVLRTAQAAPEATVIAVHLEALSHCPMRREELRSKLRGTDVEQRVLIPRDGESIGLGAATA
jgi:L-ascorbate metabolism protein UlaG (beta-lactamase superfamily)